MKDTEQKIHSSVEVTVSLDLEAFVKDTYSSRRYNPDTEEYEPNSVAAQIIDQAAIQLAKEMRDEIKDQIFDAAREAVLNLVKQVMDETIQKTDTWGKPVGTPQELREYVIAQTEAALTQKVDYNGKPVSRGGYASREDMPWLQWAMRGMVANEVTAVVKEASKAAVATIQSKATSVAADVMAREITNRLVK